MRSESAVSSLRSAGRPGGMAAQLRATTRRTSRRRSPLEWWVVIVMLLAALGVTAVGALDATTVQTLGNSAERTAIQRQALRHYEDAMYSRSAIDTGVLKAAGAGADPLAAAAEADRLRKQVDNELQQARELFVEGG